MTANQGFWSPAKYVLAATLLILCLSGTAKSQATIPNHNSATRDQTLEQAAQPVREPVSTSKHPIQTSSGEARPVLRHDEITSSDDASIVLATWTLAGITLFLALFTGGLWLATYRLAKDAKSAASASRNDFIKSMNIARRGNRIARESLIATNRPWLKISYKITSFEGSGTTFVAGISVFIQNVGNSPAKHVVELIGWPKEPVDLGDIAGAIEEQFTPSHDEIARRRRTPTLFPGDDPVTHSVLHVGTYDGSMTTPIFCGVTYSAIGIKKPLYSATIITLQIRELESGTNKLSLVASSNCGIYTN